MKCSRWQMATLLATKYMYSRIPKCLSPRPNWDFPTPSPASEYAPPPPNRRGGGGGTPFTKTPGGEGARGGPNRTIGEEA
jgi:hypothetical protein